MAKKIRDWRTGSTKRKYGETAAKVLAAADKNPSFNSTKLGALLGLHPAYIRKALSRNGRALSAR